VTLFALSIAGAAGVYAAVYFVGCRILGVRPFP
jgi:hypothetical protein